MDDRDGVTLLCKQMSEMLMFLVVVVVVAHGVNSAGFIHTSIDRMEHLVRMEAEYITELENILQTNEQNLQEISRQLSSYKKLRPHIEDPTSYVANPINCFLLIKQLTTYWKPMMTLLAGTVKSVEQIRKAMETEWDLPDDVDLTGAASGLIRLQATYRISPTDLARGYFNNQHHSSVLTAEDCRLISRYSLRSFYDMEYTASWAKEALRLRETERKTKAMSSESRESLKKVQNESQKHNITKFKNQSVTEENKAVFGFKEDVIYDQMYSAQQLDFLGEALRLSEELLQLPHTVPVREKYKRMREEFASEVGKKPYNTDGDVNQWKTNIPSQRRNEKETYERLCRGQGQISADVSSHFHCRYVNHGDPFLRLAPFKEEEVSLDPRIVVYHDAIYESEIEHIKQLSSTKLEPDVTTNTKTGKINIVRIISRYPLDPTQNILVGRVNFRGDLMTGLHKGTGRQSIVINYGIGGFTRLHLDQGHSEMGDIFSTLIYFLSDVEAGGATVFPHLNLTVFPRKGSALLWYNLHRDGGRDYRLLHAGCPVLLGSKWTIIQGHREHGQIFRKPCFLRPDGGRSKEFRETDYHYLTFQKYLLSIVRNDSVFK